jgi:hypothetical protein
MTARSLGVADEAAASYVLAVHALTVVPVTVLGLLLLGRAVPAARAFRPPSRPELQITRVIPVLG